MKRIVINGPNKLSGTVNVQGAKNSAVKHILIPLITNGIFVLKNIPDIKDIRELLKLAKLQGAKVAYIDRNTIKIDTNNINKSCLIPRSLFYTTSSAINLIPILASKFGSCEVEIDPEREDWGGDRIGSRKLESILETLRLFGFKITKRNSNLLLFTLESKAPFTFKVPSKSFAASTLAVISALFKKGTSSIYDFTEEA
jgi:UDP-N-acetylglucosamine 1-carboxyvinyltransferase